ncbi:hypothetical protein [Phenylobacterium sp.]|uniref:hypothetical protein n=1 Tax=Phenylobacterium sp. TaxID=1871053 RepID=UPI002FD916F8
MAVKFDGCAVWTPRRELLEAKGPGYASLFSAAFNSTFANRLADKRDDQAGRQREASQGRPIDWHVAERGAVEHFRKVGVPPIRVIYTAPR